MDLLDEIEMMSNSFKVAREWSPSVYIRGITNKGKNILFISNLNGDNNNVGKSNIMPELFLFIKIVEEKK